MSVIIFGVTMMILAPKSSISWTCRSVMPPETGLEMATINGAKAAGLSNRIGSIEIGKDADLVVFDTNRPEWQPLINPVANLVYSATGEIGRAHV